jgi:hypothetical protein
MYHRSRYTNNTHLLCYTLIVRKNYVTTVIRWSCIFLQFCISLV